MQLVIIMLLYRRFLPLGVLVSIHNVAENFYARWSRMTAMPVSEALMMMFLAFPTSSMALVWRQMRVSVSAWLQPSMSMISCLTTPSSTKKCRHSPIWPTCIWCSCMICAYVCSFHSFSRNVGDSVLNYGDLSASLKSAGRVCCGPMIS